MDFYHAINSFVKKDLRLVVLDAEMAQYDGYRLIQIMRTIKPVPILLISSKTDNTDRLEAFCSGAHAYISKPYRTEEYIAQAKSLATLCADIKQGDWKIQAIAYGTDLIICPLSRQVFLHETSIQLTRIEFDLLLLLASHPKRVFTREQLYRHVWNNDYSYNIDDIVKAHIKSLRKKLPNTDYIQNVWGVGYRFNANMEYRS